MLILNQSQGAFLGNLIHIFSSADDREPQYVKIIVHATFVKEIRNTTWSVRRSTSFMPHLGRPPDDLDC